MEGERRRYMSYLLRLWQAGRGTEVVWRASLQSPHAAQPVAFPTLEALFTFLRRQTGPVSDSDEVEGDLKGPSERRQS